MAEKEEEDSLVKNISTFFNRLRGEKTVRTTDKLTILNTPETERERQAKNKITSLTQFVRNKNWNRRHTEFFDEYRRMVYTYPIIKAAIDIYGEECISADTVLLQLNGTEKTIGDLYDKQVKDFWLYGINPVTKEVTPVQCEKVIHKGKRQVGELTCDDGTKIKCTPNHKFLLTSGEWVEAKDLTLGDSLQSLYTRKDSKGYLEISNGTVAKRSQRRSWKKVHSIVGNTILKEQKEELKNKYEASQDNMKVIHHKSFNKLNNDPSELEWMLWEDHRLLHNDLNTSRWENEDFSKRMGKLASERLKKNWANPEWKKAHSEKYSNTYKAKIAKMTPEERLKEFSRSGEQNGMYGVSRKGKTNPNANPNYNHIEDVNFDIYLDLLQSGKTLTELKRILNISEATEKQLCTLAKEKLFLSTRGVIFLSAIAKEFKTNAKATKEKVLNKIKPKRIKIEDFQLLGYKDQEDFVNNVLLNHRVVSFTLLEGQEDVYDVVNAGKFHNYAIKCNEGMVISHNCTITNKEGNIISIECSDNKIKKELEELFFDTLKINTKGSLITREICKFGNCYAYISVREGDGVVDLTFLPPEAMVREQMYDPQNIDLYRFLWLGGGGGSSYYEPWEIVHWKNVEDIEMEPYGVSVLRCVLDTYRRIILMREALVVYRITRAPQKLLFKIATDGLGGAEAMQYAQEIKKQVSKKSLVDPKTGEIDFKHNFLSVEENYFMPTYEGSPTDVSVLDGASNLDAVEDYKIIKDDLFAGLKIPKAYLTFDEDINAKATLCLHPDTKIPLLDGRVLTIVQISEEIKTNDNLWVYTYDKQSDGVIPTKIKWCKETQKDAKLVKVTLDNGESIITTPEHRFIKKGGEEIQAQNLTLGESLQAVYKRKKKLGKNSDYEQIFQNGKNTWEWTHKMVDEFFNKTPLNSGSSFTPIEEVNVRHHKDFNRFNNNPDNLVRMTNAEHRQLHTEHITKTLHSPKVKEKLAILFKSEEWKEQSRQINAEINADPVRKNKKSKKLSKSQKQRIKDNPKLGFKIRENNMALTPEQRSNNSKKGWLKPGKKENHILRNKERKSHLALQEGYKKSFPNGRPDMMRENNVNWKERISIVDIVTFVKGLEVRNEFNTIKKLSKALGFSKYIIQEVIEQSEFTNVSNFMNIFFGERKGRQKYFLNKEAFINTLNNSNTHEEFLVKLSITKSVAQNFYATKIKDSSLPRLYRNFVSLELGKTYNHKVVSVEFLNETSNVYDLEVMDENHNFLTDAGVVVHNSAEDARFSRVIKRIQAQLIEGLVHVGVVHLFSKGYSKKELQSFKIKMESPSTVDEKARNEILLARLDLAKSAWDYNNDSLNLMSYVDVLRSVLNFSTEEIKQTIKSQMVEKKLMWRLAQLRENGTYVDPELDQKLAQMKGLTGESNPENTPKGFDAIDFEGESLTETVKRKIDEELSDLTKPTEGKASIQQVSLLEDHGDMFKSAMQTKKDLGIDF